MRATRKRHNRTLKGCTIFPPVLNDLFYDTDWIKIHSYTFEIFSPYQLIFGGTAFNYELNIAILSC